LPRHSRAAVAAAQRVFDDTLRGREPPVRLAANLSYYANALDAGADLFGTSIGTQQHHRWRSGAI
jgi:hypothetical protein